MNETLMLVLNIILGSFFFGMMGYVFYKVLFSKTDATEQNKPRQVSHGPSKQAPKTKLIGKA